MQDVAVEAGMSPGNLYRYFPSKDALVAGLCERDRLNLGREFSELGTTAGDFLASFRALGRKHFDEANKAKAKLCLEIWAEATRNPAIAALQAEFDSTLVEQLAAAFERAKESGFVHPSVNARAVASIISKLGDGLFVRRAVSADFDPDREVAEVFAVIASLLQGAIALPVPACRSERT
jgi:AcrR family transcriptional regulator